VDTTYTRLECMKVQKLRVARTVLVALNVLLKKAVECGT
jgi:hypothetical protein